MRRNKAFTLVELLVVIGIIAVLIGILLPVLSGVQARGRDLKCQSNLRSIVQAMHGYAAENRGSMPYGFYYNRSINHNHPQGDPDPYSSTNTWREASDNAGSSGNPNIQHPFISWASLVGKYIRRGAAGDNESINFSPILKCPEAEQVWPHVVSYAANWIVSVSPYDDLRVGSAPRAQLRPPLQTWLLKDTALLWDTAIQSDWQNSLGFLLGADIDGQRFWEGARTPQYRYYSLKDPFGQLPPGLYGQNRPIQLNVGSFVWLNIDPPDPDTHYPYQGNLRYRHGKQSTCNVGFADGHVGQFTGKFTPNKALRSHDALRRQFMIKWPPGVPADQTNPY